MRLNQKTMSQSLVNDQNVVIDGMVADAVLARRASAMHRYLGARAFHRGSACSERTSLRQCEPGIERGRPITAGTPKQVSPTAAVGLPGPLWATLVLNRAVA